MPSTLLGAVDSEKRNPMLSWASRNLQLSWEDKTERILNREQLRTQRTEGGTSVRWDNEVKKLKQTGKGRQKLWDLIWLLLSTYYVSGTVLVTGDNISKEQSRRNPYTQRACFLGGGHDNMQSVSKLHSLLDCGSGNESNEVT